ncbi:GtrA family protein [bacterium]|nr:GtrA family protein [bacterium]
MSATTLVARYAAFCVVATVANLLAQRAALAVYGGPGAIAAAIGAGTLLGLAVKYLLDKRWIFDDRETGLAPHTRKAFLYTLMGVFTTAIFWGTETAFWLVYGTERMREVGAILGLTVGYVIKYRLDKRFVFRPTAV